jgi:hypothetical protein
MFVALLLALAVVQDPTQASVGVPIRIVDLVLPGSELEVADADFTTPVTVRIDAIEPHGSDLRYELVAYGLDPGSYDLGDFLRRVDGSSADDLPPIPIEVHSVLPAGQVRPNVLLPGEVADPGGYGLLLWVGGVLWVIGLVAILTVGRRRRVEEAAAARGPVTLADRLRPLVEEALAGTLSSEERAQLELTLIAFWRRKLDLGTEGAAGSLTALRGHPEAGPLLTSLEDWLHRPEPPADVDIASLLAPYKDLPADALGAEV